MPDRDLRDQKDVIADNERLAAEVAALKKERDAAVAKAALLERASADQVPQAKPTSTQAGAALPAAVVGPQPPPRPAPAPVATPRPPTPAPPPGAMTAELLAQALELMDRRREQERSLDRSDKLRARFAVAHAKGGRVDLTSVDEGTAAAVARMPRPVEAPKPPRL